MSKYKGLRILILEDNSLDYRIIKHEVEQNFPSAQIFYTFNKKEITHILATENIDIILSDHNMPDFNSFQVIDIIKESKLNIPVIVISGTIGEEQAVEIIKYGANDYLLKDRLKRLPIIIKKEIKENKLKILLKENQAELKAIYDNAPLVMLLIDNNQRIVKLNGQALLMTLSSTEEVIGHRSGDALRCIHHFDDPKGCGYGDACNSCGIRNTIFETFKTGKPFYRISATIPYNHTDGIIDMSILVSTTLLKVVGKERVLVTIEDITERKLIEKSLAQNKAKLKNAQRIAKIGSWEFNLLTNKLLWSDEVYRIFDLKPHEFELNYESFLENVHPDDREFVNKTYLYSLENKEAYNIEHRLKLKDGTIKYVREHYETVYDEIDKSTLSVGTVQDITEQYLAKQKEEKSNKKYKSLFNNMTNGFSFCKMIFDKNNNPIDYKFIDINPAFEKMTGVKASNVIGKTARQIFHGIENDPANWIGRYGDVSITQTSIRFEDYSQTIGKWFLVNSYSPKKGFFATTFEDISEQKIASLLLKESENKYKTFIESSPTSIFIVDKNGNFTFVNNAACKLLGYSQKELIKIKVINHIAPTHMRQGIRSFIDAKTTGKVRLDNFQIYKKDKTTIDIILDAVKIDDNNFIAFCIDVTKLKKTKKELQESKSKYKRLFEDSPASLWEEDFTEIKTFLDELKIKGVSDFRQYFTDNPKELLACVKKRKILDVNKATLEIHEAKSKKELIKGLDKTFTKQSFNIFKEEFALLAEGITEYETETVIKTLQGEIKDINLKFSVISSPEKNKMKALAAVIDITEQKKADRMLAKSYYDLTTKNKELEQFSYVTTHDMRSPILNLKGLLEVFEKRNLINKQNEQIVKRINISVDSLYETLHDLIGIIEYQKSIDDTVRKINFEKFLSDILKDISYLTDNEDISINIDFSLVPDIYYIPGHIRSILQNLLSNSIKHRDLTRRLEIEKKSEKQDDYILLTVKDNGIGIKTEHQQKVFELFKSINPNANGKGIGLFITKSQIESKGGRIELESDYGKGSIFKVYLKDLL